MRIHCVDVVPRLLQPLVDEIADGVVTVVARHARDGNTLLRQKIVHFRVESRRLHKCLPHATLSANRPRSLLPAAPPRKSSRHPASRAGLRDAAACRGFRASFPWTRHGTTRPAAPAAPPADTRSTPRN